MKKFVFYLLVVLFPAITFADKQNEGKRPGPVSTYIKEHIMPVVQVKRIAFDANLSATEKNELASIREELQQLRENHKSRMQQSEEAADNNVAVSHEQRSENHAKMRDLMEQVRLIADRHESQLNEIFTSLAPQQKQWKEDITKLISSLKSEDENSFPYFRNEFLHDGMSGRARTWSRTRFLLMDASQPGNADAERTQGIAPSSSLSMDIYPNPAVNMFSLNLSGIPAENKLTVTDVTGKVVFSKENIQTAEPIDCNNFNNGIYFVRLSSADNDINQKLIVSH